jgi:tetratricopeptide (TPR) repeat protein
MPTDSTSARAIVPKVVIHSSGVPQLVDGSRHVKHTKGRKAAQARDVTRAVRGRMSQSSSRHHAGECALVAAAWMAACAHNAQPARSAPQRNACTVHSIAESAQPGRARIVVAEFRSTGGSDDVLGPQVTQQILDSFRRFREEELPSMPVAISPQEVEFVRARCEVQSHEEAEHLAEPWGADLVIWGDAYRNPGGLQRPVSINQHISTGNVAVSGGISTIGSIVVESQKPFTVSASATLGRTAVHLRRTSPDIDFGSLARLELPALPSSAPMQLVNFGLGLYFSDRPWIAAHFLERSLSKWPADAENRLAPFYAYIGRAYLELPNGAARALAYGEKVIASGELAGTAAEASLLTLTGAALHAQADYARAYDRFSRALQLDFALFGQDSEPSTHDLINMAATLRALGRYQDAATSAAMALALREKLFGPYDSGVASAASSLGAIFTEPGHYQGGLPFLQRAMEIDEHNQATRELIHDYNALGWNYAGQQRYADAEHFYRKAISLGNKLLGEGHLDNATTLGNLGWAISGRGDQEQALVLLQKTKEMFERAEGPEHPDLAIQLEHIGTALLRQRQFGEAVQNFERALEIDRRALGAEHPVTIWIEERLAKARAAASGFVRGESQGAIVWRLQSNAPVTTKLQTGDWIQACARPIHAAADLASLLAASKPYPLTLVRNGKKETFSSSLTGVLLLKD